MLVKTYLEIHLYTKVKRTLIELPSPEFLLLGPMSFKSIYKGLNRSQIRSGSLNFMEPLSKGTDTETRSVGTCSQNTE